MTNHIKHELQFVNLSYKLHTVLYPYKLHHQYLKFITLSAMS